MDILLRSLVASAERILLQCAPIVVASSLSFGFRAFSGSCGIAGAVRACVEIQDRILMSLTVGALGSVSFEIASFVVSGLT